MRYWYRVYLWVYIKMVTSQTSGHQRPASKMLIAGGPLTQLTIIVLFLILRRQAEGDYRNALRLSVRQSVSQSVSLSVIPSVTLSCPPHTSWTLWMIFIKLHSNGSSQWDGVQSTWPSYLDSRSQVQVMWFTLKCVSAPYLLNPLNGFH